MLVGLDPDVTKSVDRKTQGLTVEEDLDLPPRGEGGQGKTSVIPMR